MQLIYRGATFNYTPAQPAARHLFQQVRHSETAYNLRYRGITYQADPNAKTEKVSEQSRAYELCYRGLKYNVNRHEQGEVTAIAAAAIASKHKTAVIAYSTSQQAEGCSF